MVAIWNASSVNEVGGTLKKLDKIGPARKKNILIGKSKSVRLPIRVVVRL